MVIVMTVCTMQVSKRVLSSRLGQVDFLPGQLIGHSHLHTWQGVFQLN